MKTPSQKPSLIRAHIGIFGPVCGMIAGIIVSTGFTLWDWVENPGGIFRGPDGTNWKYVSETAESWFVPTFFVITLIAMTTHCAGAAIRRRFRK